METQLVFQKGIINGPLLDRNLRPGELLFGRPDIHSGEKLLWRNTSARRFRGLKALFAKGRFRNVSCAFGLRLREG